MVAMTISLVMMAALVGVFVNTSQSAREMSKTNALIDNGRFAVELLQADTTRAVAATTAKIATQRRRGTYVSSTSVPPCPSGPAPRKWFTTPRP